MWFALFCPRLTSSDVVLIVLLSAGSILFSRMPIFGVVFYPFQIFGVFVHELCHGIMAILTGGEFRRFSVYQDRSGVARFSGGIRWLIFSAGYMGTAIIGGFLIILAASDLSASAILTILGGSLACICLFFARNFFGFVMGIGMAVLLFLAGRQLGSQWAELLLLFLAVQTSLNALHSVVNLVNISRSPIDFFSDAQMMRQLTGIPAPLWAVLWVIISITALLLALTVAYCPQSLPMLLRM